MVGIDNFENNNNINQNNNNMDNNRNQKNNKNKKMEEDMDESPPLPHPRQSPRGDGQLQNCIPPPLPPKSRSPMGNTQQSKSSLGNLQNSSIVLVGNLRAKSRSAEPSLNIEKRREKDGVIIDDEDDMSPPEAPLKEKIYEEKVEDRKSRLKTKSANSSKRRVARSQFRTVTPEPEDSIDESREYIQEPRWREHKEGDYYTEDQLLTTRDHLEEEMGNLTVQILKSGNSEMGDSGISSNPASISTPGMSPKSDSLDETKAQDFADKIIPPGKKRDTMLRELKSKLKERFPSNGLSSPPAASRHSEPSQQYIQEKHAEVGPKLSKLFMDRTIDPKSKALIDPYGSMRKTRPIGEREEREESKMEFLQRRASLRRVSKGGESSGSSHLETVEESDTCDCESSCYNSEYDREFHAPPNPPPTAASNRYSCTPDQGHRSPDRRYNRSPEQRHNGSQDQRHNRSPDQGHRSPDRRYNRSPEQRHNGSQDQRHNRSPEQRQDGSPERRRNRSPEQRYTRSPDMRHNGSSEGRYTRSPEMRHNGSPEGRYTRSPDRRHNRSPKERYTRSPDRRHNGSPDRRHNGSPDRRHNGSPDRRHNGSPNQRYLSSPNHPPTMKNNERPTSSKSQISDVSKLSLSEKRELVYGPGGIFGSSGPFSTPGVSRYPEPTKPRSKPDQGYTEDVSLTSCRSSSTVTATSDSAMFAEDRSDKSQYVANTVIKAVSPTSPPPKSGKSSDPHSSSRLENYRAEGWIQEKQLRMMSWITRTQQTR